MVGVIESDKATLFGESPVLPILHSQLESDLNGSRTIIGIKDVLER